MNRAHAREVIRGWKDRPREIAETLLRQYGEPHEVMPERLIWRNHGPWKRTELINEEIPHRFPEPHHDSLMQTIPYRVPPAVVSELAQYDGSVVVERTRGELAARCDSERANYLALNLAHEIIVGRKTAQQARRFYAEAVQREQHQEYLEGFLFPGPGQRPGRSRRAGDGGLDDGAPGRFRIPPCGIARDRRRGVGRGAPPAAPDQGKSSRAGASARHGVVAMTR